MKTILKIVRWLLLPVVPIYFLVTWCRNKLYDWELLKSKSYNIPVICVGNLSTGGTGKTPMVEYLIRLLKPDHRVAILSRGYKRVSEGYILASKNTTAAILGDEPFQIYSKFKDITVAVDADRQHGIQMLQSQIDPDVILLDDAYQHRKVRPGFTVLLTAYDSLYTDDFVLPTGNLREPKSGAHRADAIIVTKSPINLEASEKDSIRHKIHPSKSQEVFFSSIVYADVLEGDEQGYTLEDLKGNQVCLVTGIANPEHLIKYLKAKGLKFDHLNFPDHHHFSDSEIKNLNSKEVVLTTEKDYVRLVDRLADKTKLFYVSIETKLDNSAGFDEMLTNYVISHSQN